MKKLLGSLVLAAMIGCRRAQGSAGPGSALQGNVHSSGHGNAQHR